MPESSQAIFDHVLSLVQRFGARRVGEGADKLIGADHGVTGSDSIELLEALEQTYGIDLRSFGDARATRRKGWFGTRTMWGDATVRALADYIASLIRPEPPGRDVHT